MALGSSTINSAVIRDAEGGVVGTSKAGSELRLNVRDDGGDNVQAQILTTLIEIRDILMEMNS